MSDFFSLFQNDQVGDWVRVKASVPSPKYGWEDVHRTSIGVIRSLEEDGDMGIAFCFRSKIFSCSMTDMEKVSPFEVEQEIRVMPSITEPLLGWSNEMPSTSGKIARIDMDGTLNVSMLIVLIILLLLLLIFGVGFAGIEFLTLKFLVLVWNIFLGKSGWQSELVESFTKRCRKVIRIGSW